MAKHSNVCSFITITTISFVINLSSLRHAYVTATTSTTNNSDDAMRLLRDVIDPYDNRVRPILNQSNPVEVFMTYNLVNLIEIDEVNQRIAINIWVNFSWWDEFRTWNPDDYGGNDVIHPNPTDVWRPKTVLINSDKERDVFKNSDTPFSLYSTGATRWYIGGVYYFVCAMELTYFPYDQQECNAEVMSTNLGPEIHFTPTPDMQLLNYIVNGEWDYVSSQVTYQLVPVSRDEDLGFIVASVTFKRRPLYYLINILIPTMCLSILSLFGFVVPKDSGERASFAITVLLSLAVYMSAVSSQLPSSSDSFPLFTIYIFSIMCLSMLSVLIIVCQLRMVGSSCTEDSKNSKSNEGNNLENRHSDDNLQHEKSLETMIENFNRQQNEHFSKMRYYGKSNQVAPQSGHNEVKPFGKRFENNNQIEDNDNNINDNGLYDTSMSDLNKYWNGPPEKFNYKSSFSTRLRILFLKHDDAILMAIFSVLWVCFTIAFVAKISQHP